MRSWGLQLINSKILNKKYFGNIKAVLFKLGTRNSQKLIRLKSNESAFMRIDTQWDRHK